MASNLLFFGAARKRIECAVDKEGHEDQEDEGEVEQVEVQPALLLHPLDPLAVVVEGDVEEGADDNEADDELLVDPVLHAQVQLRKITATLHDENLKTNC